jgi:urease alpha subunit
MSINLVRNTFCTNTKDNLTFTVTVVHSSHIDIRKLWRCCQADMTTKGGYVPGVGQSSFNVFIQKQCCTLANWQNVDSSQNHTFTIVSVHLFPLHIQPANIQTCLTSTTKTEVAGSSETLVITYQTIWCHNLNINPIKA